ncbi:MAG: hypothetical protein LBS59_01575 [Puniceicoccales bacterium]|jgi:rhodanese-related sulfurtransferase|nr:hypothetical protein [Puniceicoccales bacterium]
MIEIFKFKTLAHPVSAIRAKRGDVKILFLLALTGIFLYTGITKLLDGVLFADAVAGYKVLPVWGVNVVAVVLPMLEVVVGVAVLVRRTRRAALGIMGVLLGVFMVALVQAKVRGLEIDCGCFGGGKAEKSGLYWAVARDVVLLGMVVFLLKQRGRVAAKEGEARGADKTEEGKGEAKAGEHSFLLQERVLLGKELQYAGLLASGAVVLAVGVNLLRERPLGWHFQNPRERVVAEAESLRAQGRGKAEGEVEAALGAVAKSVAISKGKVASYEEVKAVADGEFGEKVLLVDARPDLFFEEGHIAGAINLPSGEFVNAYRRHEAALKTANRIVVYCDGGGCESSAAVVEALEKLGFADVAEYKGGWREWELQKRALAVSVNGRTVNKKTANSEKTKKEGVS